MIIETHRGYEVTGIRLFNDNNYRSITLADKIALIAKSWDEFKETVILHSMFWDLLLEERNDS